MYDFILTKNLKKCAKIGVQALCFVKCSGKCNWRLEIHPLEKGWAMEKEG